MSLHLSNLIVRYNTKTILNKLSFSVNNGHGSLISGANGAGKTTIFNAIAGLIPYDGTIQSPKKISYVTAHHPFDEDLSAKDNLDHIMFINNINKGKEYIDKYINFSTKDRVRTLSSGQIKRLQLTASLSHDHPLWLIDEAHANLDHEARKALKDDIHNHINTYNGIVCLISHETDPQNLGNRWIEVKL